MRLLALVVAVSSTGALHAVDDLADAFAGCVHEDESCCSDGDLSHECPPGCPSCHGASGFVRALLPNADTVELLSPAIDEVTPWFVELGAPRQTYRLSVYRPPRSASHSS